MAYDFGCFEYSMRLNARSDRVERKTRCGIAKGRDTQRAEKALETDGYGAAQA